MEKRLRQLEIQSVCMSLTAYSGFASLGLQLKGRLNDCWREKIISNPRGEEKLEWEISQEKAVVVGGKWGGSGGIGWL